MRRAVAADADGVLAEDERHRQAHHGGEAQRRPQIVGEHQIGDADRHDAAVCRHAVHHRAHRVLADAVMDVTAAVVRCGERLETALVLRRALQVRRARRSAPGLPRPDGRRSRPTA